MDLGAHWLRPASAHILHKNDRRQRQHGWGRKCDSVRNGCHHKSVSDGAVTDIGTVGTRASLSQKHSRERSDSVCLSFSLSVTVTVTVTVTLSVSLSLSLSVSHFLPSSLRLPPSPSSLIRNHTLAFSPIEDRARQEEDRRSADIRRRTRVGCDRRMFTRGRVARPFAGG